MLLGAHHEKVDAALDITRRNFLGLSAAAAFMFVAPPVFAVTPPARALKFHNTHTGESLSTTYWAEGRYVPSALAEIKKVLRDHRSGDEHEMSPALMDLLFDLTQKLETSETIEIISGYRSPKSNAAMAQASSGVGKKSLHMQGKAVDIRIPGIELKHLHKTALAMKRGGVGFYPSSDFVHVDVGDIRHWEEKPRTTEA